jgi:hypothetical protein
LTFSGDTNTGIFSPAADTIAFTEGGVESMRIDSAGNLGLGVTPSAWGVYKAIDILSGGTVFGAATNYAGLGSNCFNNGSGWRYKNTAVAGLYQLETNTHVWYTAASGTAGNAITFTQAMTLDADGDLGVGTTTPNKSGVNKTLTINGSANAGLELAAGDSLYGLIFANSSRFSIDTNNTGANLINFYTSGSERARIDSSGNLLVGTTSSTNAGRITAAADSAGAAYPLMVNNTNTGSGSQIVVDILRNGTRVGSISNTNTATTYATSSDYRLKHDIQPMIGALAKVAALKPCTYKWKADGSDGEGFIAHELAEVCPQAVTGEKDAVDEEGNIKPQGIDTSFLVATLTAAIKELKAELDATKAEVALLKGAK